MFLSRYEKYCKHRTVPVSRPAHINFNELMIFMWLSEFAFANNWHKYHWSTITNNGTYYLYYAFEVKFISISRIAAVAIIMPEKMFSSTVYWHKTCMKYVTYVQYQETLYTNYVNPIMPQNKHRYIVRCHWISYFS